MGDLSAIFMVEDDGGVVESGVEGEESAWMLLVVVVRKEEAR